MSGEVYLNNLINNLLVHKQNVLLQQGKSDIEPPDYVEKTEMWYAKLLEWVNNGPPQNYVRAINVIQDAAQDIRKVDYAYCEGKVPTHIAINIFGDQTQSQ